MLSSDEYLVMGDWISMCSKKALQEKSEDMESIPVADEGEESESEAPNF